MSFEQYADSLIAKASQICGHKPSDQTVIARRVSWRVPDSNEVAVLVGAIKDGLGDRWHELPCSGARMWVMSVQEAVVGICATREGIIMKIWTSDPDLPL